MLYGQTLTVQGVIEIQIFKDGQLAINNIEGLHRHRHHRSVLFEPTSLKHLDRRPSRHGTLLKRCKHMYK
jgi:hypothetical protein